MKTKHIAIKVTHYGEDYAVILVHCELDNGGGRTSEYEVPIGLGKALEDYLNENQSQRPKQ